MMVKCSPSCGKCCDILVCIKEYGDIYPTLNKHYNDWLEKFISHFDNQKIKPLFDWRCIFKEGNEYLRRLYDNSGIDIYSCPYKYSQGCTIPRENRHPDCLNYNCKEEKK